jgi:5-bromo-4-chloroindolyl phosphate hydrolysis protein
VQIISIAGAKNWETYNIMNCNTLTMRDYTNKIQQTKKNLQFFPNPTNLNFLNKIKSALLNKIAKSDRSRMFEKKSGNLKMKKKIYALIRFLMGAF